MARLVDALGSDGSPALALYELAERLQTPLALADIGFDGDDLPEAAELVFEGAKAAEPHFASVSAARETLDNAFAGMRPGAGRTEGSRA